MKPPSPLWSLTVTTAPEAEDAVAELLLRLTGEPAVITQSRLTGLSTVAVYLERPPAPGRPRPVHHRAGDAPPCRPGPNPWAPLKRALRDGLVSIAAHGLDLRPARISCRRVPPRDWQESWKRHFRPLVFGRVLLVRPSWSRRRPRHGQAELVLDPGLSFGTGQHPTTGFCLREIVRLRPRAAARGVLDVGTGSGILALAAAKLGYTPVEAFDFDPEAVIVARRNAADNGLAGRLHLAKRDVARLPLAPRRRFAVVCANLTANLLLAHAERLAAQVSPGGHLVLAGILDTEFPTVARHFAGLGFQLLRSARQQEWRSGSFRGTTRETGSPLSSRAP